MYARSDLSYFGIFLRDSRYEELEERESTFNYGLHEWNKSRLKLTRSYKRNQTITCHNLITVCNIRLVNYRVYSRDTENGSWTIDIISFLNGLVWYPLWQDWQSYINSNKDNILALSRCNNKEKQHHLFFCFMSFLQLLLFLLSQLESFTYFMYVTHTCMFSYILLYGTKHNLKNL